MQSACTISHSIRTSELDIQFMGGDTSIIGANRVGNRARTLHSYISVTDIVKLMNRKNQ